MMLEIAALSFPFGQIFFLDAVAGSGGVLVLDDAGTGLLRTVNDLALAFIQLFHTAVSFRFSYFYLFAPLGEFPLKAVFGDNIRDRGRIDSIEARAAEVLAAYQIFKLRLRRYPRESRADYVGQSPPPSGGRR